MEEQRNYYAIIPANVRYDKELPANAKLLYGEITALCNAKGYCWATNDYFANLYGVSKTSISKWISSLIKRGYIFSEIEYKEGTKEILNRYLKIVNEPIEEKLNRGIEEKLKDNNTSFNNTTNNTNNKKESKKEKKSNYDAIINELIKDKDVKEGIYEFIKMRKLMKKPLTDRALKNIINKLFTLSTNKEEQLKILNNSIESNWLSVFPLKKDNYGSKRKEIVPDWMNKKNEVNPATKEEQEEMAKLLNPDLADRVAALKEKLQK